MKKMFFIFTLASLVLLSTLSHALSTQGLRYYFVGGRALSLVESTPKPKDTLTFGFGTNYAYHTLEVGNAVGARISGVVDHLVTFDFLGSYSFSDAIAVGVNIPLHFTRNLSTFGSTAMENNFNFGDVMLTGIYNIINPGDNASNCGFAVAPFVTLPSGANSDYVGDSHITGGFLLIGDMLYSGHYFGLNLGLKFRETENFLGLSVASEFLYRFAYHHVISENIGLEGFGELGGATVLKDFWQKSNSSPFEVGGGLTKSFLDDNVLKVTAGFGVGLGGGYAAPDVRGLIKLSYDYPIKRKPVVINRIEKIEKELKELTIYYPTAGAEVDPYYDAKIAGIAKILKGNPDLGPLYILGATDDVGSDTYNQTLSEKRAKQAFNSIVGQGLSPAFIVYAGFGESFPAVENSSDANRALNRRTLFTFVKPVQLQEKPTQMGTVGYNTVTGKKSDSYTEVLKELDQRRQGASEESGGVVIKNYKDDSAVIVDEKGQTKIKEGPGVPAQEVNIKSRSKKYYEEKPKTTDDADVVNEDAVKKKDIKEKDLVEDELREEDIIDGY
ncbi:MAG: OmpA family protein [Deltaproteobacteria bacterium]|nr:OmpA family protein [Deltaproteobacteria bacterium]